MTQNPMSTFAYQQQEIVETESMITQPNDGVGVIDLGYLDQNAAITELAIQYENLPRYPVCFGVGRSPAGA